MKILIPVFLVLTGCNSRIDCHTYSVNASSRWRSEQPREYVECISSEVYGPYFSGERAQSYANRLNATGSCLEPGAYVVPHDERRKRWPAYEYLVFCPR